MKTKWQVIVVGTCIVVPLLVVLAMGFGQDPHAIPSVLEGKAAPPFDLVDLMGKHTSLKSLAGKPAVINFWATWCYPCQAEFELLQEAAQRYAGRVNVVGVIYQDSAGAVRDYLNKRINVYPHLQDPESRVAIDFGVAGVPESFILDSNGRIVHKQAGVLDEQTLRQRLADLGCP